MLGRLVRPSFHLRPSLIRLRYCTMAAPPSPAPVAPAAQPPRPTTTPKEKKPKKDLAAGMTALELDPKPAYIDSRIALFDTLKAASDARIAGTSTHPCHGADRHSGAAGRDPNHFARRIRQGGHQLGDLPLPDRTGHLQVAR